MDIMQRDKKFIAAFVFDDQVRQVFFFDVELLDAQKPADPVIVMHHVIAAFDINKII